MYKVSQEKDPGQLAESHKVSSVRRGFISDRPLGEKATVRVAVRPYAAMLLNLIPPYFFHSRSGSTHCYWCLDTRCPSDQVI
jgi:hypothetical protein